MRERLTVLATGILVCAVTSVHCSAYTLYARGRTAEVLDERYSEELSEINSRFEAALEQPEPPESSDSELLQTSESEQPENTALAELYAERIATAQEYWTELGKNGRVLAEKLIAVYYKHLTLPTPP
ncbi:MAG: hypothetical protein K2N29_01165, partial [Ruminiclostridium sp.]|nr:hypothetical protein [Ruminiclostridium sp.]